MNPEVRLVWNTACVLGEGPVWVADEAALRFVDIKSGHLHRYCPPTGGCETLDVGGKPSFIVPETGGGLLVGSEHGVWRMDIDRLGDCVAAVEQPLHNRTNDACVDGRGRLWFGTMDEHEKQSTGMLYCLDAHGLHPMGCEAVVTNGPAITIDGTTLYHVDSANRRVWRYTIKEGPMLSDGHIFLQLSEEDGYPDGVTLDSEGDLWVALWDGWSVRCYAQDGSLLMTVKLPCARVTKIAFGGPDLRTAFVTTARLGMDSLMLEKQPHAGGLFSFDAPFKGNPQPLAKLRC